MQPEKKRPYRERPYFKIAVTALVVIFISILLVVIFTDLPGFSSVLFFKSGKQTIYII